MLGFLKNKRGRYSGPVCFIDRDQISPEGGKLYGGWHYATKTWKGHEIPDANGRLHLNTDDPENPHYEWAEKHHQSWVDKHGVGNVVRLGE